MKADGPIKTPKDMEGRTLGGPANDGALKLFPAFAKLAGIDAAKIQLTNMQANLREQMLQRGQVDLVRRHAVGHFDRQQRRRLSGAHRPLPHA